MGKWRLAILTLAALLLGGCAEWKNVTPDAAQLTRIAVEFPPDPTKEALQATAVARYVAAEEARQAAEAARIAEQNAASERQAAEAECNRQILAMTAEAQAVIDARENEALATRQAINSQATAQAVAVEGTRQAQNLSTTATAQTVSVATTATMQSAQAAVEGTAQAAIAISAEATAQAVQRQTERERITQPLRTFGPWLLAVLALVLVMYLGLKAWTLFEDRKRLVRRRPDEGEPVMIVSRERLALPLRQFRAYADMTHQQERAPLLAPTVEAQESATMRQQTTNAILAQQAGKIAQAKSGTARGMVLPPGKRSTSRNRRKQVPGLGKVIARL
jgi:hypothetical protein